MTTNGASQGPGDPDSDTEPGDGAGRGARTSEADQDAEPTTNAPAGESPTDPEQLGPDDDERARD